MNALLLGMGEPVGDTLPRLAAYAERMEGRIHYVTYTSRGSRLGPQVFGGRVHVHPTRSRSHLHYFRDAAAIVRDEARRFTPDVVYAQDPFGTALVGLWVRRRYGTPLVIGNHSNFLENPGWVGERPLYFRLLHRVAEFVLPRADAWRVVNPVQRDVYVERLGIPRARVTVLGTPTDVRRFAEPQPERAAALREQLGIPADAPVMLWVGRPVPVKRLPVLVEAFGHVAARHPRARLLVVGKRAPDADDVGALQAAAADPRVIWLQDGVPHAELPAYYQLSTVYTHTSVYEGLSKVMLEAAAAGLPIVTTAVPGQEIVRDGETGFVTPVDDPRALAERVISLFDDPETALRMGGNGQRRVLETFDRDRGIDAFIQMLRRAARPDQGD
ncbi:MAG TPA: glycosyltransferase family 4 protein [Longimicrobium sp.]|jgi:glycosyltransferase involved in cell wall biosynthesis|uniref:glycosyltransferase family 4 protein n=1 Tax=Longimicrobium sp. TaxID=2029185 RepID=UPI002ED82567